MGSAWDKVVVDKRGMINESRLIRLDINHVNADFSAKSTELTVRPLPLKLAHCRSSSTTTAAPLLHKKIMVFLPFN